MGRLYCGDGNGHIHFESFSSHISLTLRTPVLFIFRRVTRIGHGVKFILKYSDKCSGKRHGRLQSLLFFLFFFSNQHSWGERECRKLGTVRCGHSADCQHSKTPTLTGPLYNASVEQNYTGQSPVRNSSLNSQPWSKEKLKWKFMEKGANRDWPAVFPGKGSSPADHPQATVNHDERSQKKRIKSSLPSIRSSWDEGLNDGWKRGKEVNWHGVCVERELVGEGLK